MAINLGRTSPITLIATSFDRQAHVGNLCIGANRPHFLIRTSMRKPRIRTATVLISGPWRQSVRHACQPLTDEEMF
jgi:hypothetical protein